VAARRRHIVSDFVQDGGFVVMVVRIADAGDPGLESRLADQVAGKAGFVANAPVVVDIAGCEGLATADAFQKLKALFKRQYLILIGIQNGNATQIRAAANAGLAAFAPGTLRVAPESPRVAPESPAVPMAAPPAGGAARTRVVTLPVRSGTQIYAKGGDMIVLSAVSPGAEVLADGNLHVYGPLRGRAIAGAAGDPEARIFVSKLEAELLCVAGHYLVSEQIGPELRGQAVQVALADGKLVVTRT
jgi:septum site-determining protein MinC